MKKLTGFIKLALFAGVLFTSCESISQEESLIRDIPACVSGKIVFSNSDDSSGAAVFIVKQNADKSSAVSKGNVKAISKKISASSSEKSFRSALDESGIEKCFLTQKDGNFRFEGLEGGFYRIFVYYDNSLEKVKERTVLLTKNHELILADFNFTKTCAVKGTLNFGADSEIEKNGFSVMVEGFSQVSLTDTEGNYYLSDVPLSSNLKLVVSKNEVSYPVFLEIPESNGVYETENDIELKNFIPESNDDELQSESADKNAEIKLFNYRGSYLSADEIDEVNEYDFYFNESDGSSYIFIDGVWVLFAKGGRDGFNGIDGKNGRDGIDGVNGKDGRDGIDGKDGQNGVNGKDGRDGIDGKNGLDGKDGLNGKDGRDGIDGKNGSDGKRVGWKEAFILRIGIDSEMLTAEQAASILIDVAMNCGKKSLSLANFQRYRAAHPEKDIPGVTLIQKALGAKTWNEAKARAGLVTTPWLGH